MCEGGCVKVCVCVCVEGVGVTVEPQNLSDLARCYALLTFLGMHFLYCFLLNEFVTCTEGEPE